MPGEQNMTVRTKAYIAVLSAAAALIAVFYVISESLLLGGFLAVERGSMAQNVARAQDAITAQSKYLENKAGDWADWDDTYAFIEDGNSQYVESNLTDQGLIDLGINVLLFIRPNGDVLAAKAMDLTKQEARPVPQGLENQLTPDSVLMQAVQPGESHSGLVLLPEGPMLVVSRPILTSNAEGPSRGMLLMGRFLDASFVGQLDQTTHLSVDLRRLDDTAMPPDFQEARAKLTGAAPVLTLPETEQSISGFTVLDDISGHPALLLKVSTPRPIYEQAQLTMRYIFWALVAVGLVFGAAVLILVDRMVRAWQARKESEERYSRAVAGANDGLWDWNLVEKKVYYSPRWKSILGFGVEGIGESPEEWLSRIHPDDRARVQAELAAHLEGRAPCFESEHRLQRRDEEFIWVLNRGLAVRGRDGKAYRMAGSTSDITSRKRAEEQLVHDAFHDTLTGLSNRALLVDRLGLAVERARRTPRYHFAVLYLDLDRFKVINDTFGHPIGDQLLISCATRLKMCLRSIDTIARLGGDEFVVLLEDSDDTWTAARVAERIGHDLALPFELDGHQLFVTVSTGVVLGGANYERPEQLMRDADIAMYRAKSAGRARYEIFDDTMREKALAHLEIEAGLRGAIERCEFELHYQPIIYLKTGQVTGFEALVRWRHPERGLIAPDEFIPVAEESGLIVMLGDWVLREACAQMRTWQTQYRSEPPLKVNVNLSTKQFAQHGLPERIVQILQETGLDARSLRLEITESAIMEDSALGSQMLARLQEIGVEVEIDDFGTGYSSLSYLQQFPINTLKIDRSFVQRMSSRVEANATGDEIVHTILKLAQQLGLTVVAEGVETAEQLSQLKALDCEYGQGYLISRPMAKANVDSFLTDLIHEIKPKEVSGAPIPAGDLVVNLKRMGVGVATAGE
jgi:diguanylate cyclase (GGDEF)-like protein/PAS domain S-box-containing protein